jgi:uncharacterized protein
VADPKRWTMTEEDMESLLRGCAILGTGGGGSSEFGRAIMSNDLRRGRTYELVDVADIPDDALVVSGGIMGSVRTLERYSPQEIVERWEEQFELLTALRAMESHLGRTVDYVVPFELGGLNTPVILSLAARAGIPVIDGDGLGRAAPETQMTSFIGHGVQLTPMPLVDAKGNLIIVDRSTSLFFPDEVGRFVVTQAGGLGANTHYPMDGRTARRAIVPQTISKAVHLGTSVKDLQAIDAVRQVLSEQLRAQHVFYGRVLSLEEQQALGFLVQIAHLQGLGTSDGSSLDLAIKNEYMMASMNGVVGCLFPDLILVLDEQGGGVMSTDMHPGDTVHVFVAPCHPRLREAAMSSIGAEAHSPSRYGYPDLSYSPVEQLGVGWSVDGS